MTSVVALYSYLREHPQATSEDIEHGLDGNLCRCTGYRPILDAARKFGVDAPCQHGCQSDTTGNDYLEAEQQSLTEATTSQKKVQRLPSN